MEVLKMNYNGVALIESAKEGLAARSRGHVLDEVRDSFKEGLEGLPPRLQLGPNASGSGNTVFDAFSEC